MHACIRPREIKSGQYDIGDSFFSFKHSFVTLFNSNNLQWQVEDELPEVVLLLTVVCNTVVWVMKVHHLIPPLILHILFDWIWKNFNELFVGNSYFFYFHFVEYWENAMS